MPNRGKPPSYQLIKASSTDEAWLEQLRRKAYEDLYQATWGEWDEARHRRQFSECMKRGGISIIEVDGSQVGMVQVRDVSDGIEICEIQVEPRHQNRGVGTSVLLDIMSAARQQGKCVRLSVGVRNEDALRLYRLLGFRSVGRSDTHEHMMYGRATGDS